MPFSIWDIWRQDNSFKYFDITIFKRMMVFEVRNLGQLLRPFGIWHFGIFFRLFF
jgi:hypothetical protein